MGAVGREWCGKRDAGVGSEDAVARGKSCEPARGTLGPPSLAASSAYRVASRCPAVSRARRSCKAASRCVGLYVCVRVVREQESTRDPPGLEPKSEPRFQGEAGHFSEFHMYSIAYL